MLVCVTGGTGFVGSHIVRALIDEGHQVRVLHRPTSKLDALTGLDYESVIGDVMDTASLMTAFEGCDWVFHVAAVADYWRADTRRLFAVNVDGTQNVLNIAREKTVKRVIFTSSAATIGLPDNTNPIPSDERVPFNLAPEQFPYAYSKYVAEQRVQDAVARGQDVVILNPSVVIGAGDLNQISGTYILQTAQMQWLIPKSSGGIAVVDVRDVAQGHLEAAKRGKTGERYILNTANYTNNDWFKMIAEIVGVAPPLLPSPNFMLPIAASVINGLRAIGINTPIDATQVKLGGRYVWFDGSKAHHELHQPQIDMRQSVRETYEWYVRTGIIRPTAMRTILKLVSGRLGVVPPHRRNR